MTTPTVAALDANGIIGLAKADCFPLLQNLFTEVCVPPAVVSEITDPVSQTALQNALGHWLIAGHAERIGAGPDSVHQRGD